MAEIKRIFSVIIVIAIILCSLPFTASADSSSSEKVFFGSYPQSEVSDIVVLDKLNSMKIQWNSYNYYTGTGIMNDGKMRASDYMRYCDVTLDGEKYRGVIFDTFRPYFTGLQTTVNGNSYQDNNGYECNKVYWFKFEPLEWKVVDSSTGYIICESIIDCQPFQNMIFYNGFEYFADYQYYDFSNYYVVSNIRKWLNSDFYNCAFSDNEKSNITINYMDDLWIDINDKVFLPSANEMKNTNYWSNDASRIATGTDYAKCQGLFVDGGNSYWYLRSPADNSYTACAVSTDGTLYSYDYYYNRYSFFTSSNTTGIRPAIKLNNLNSDTVKKSANPEKAINVPQAKKLDFFSKAKAFFVNITDTVKYFLTSTADSNEKAVAVINSVSKGINMPCMESGWARDYILEKDTFENVKNKGFDYIRLPVNFASMLDYDGKFNESAMFNLDTVLQYAMDAGLTVILDFHGWVELNDNLTADNIETLISIWKQVAERYVDYPEQLCFEIYNEPSNTSGKMTSAKWNYIQNTATAAIRAVDDDRIIVLSPESYNAASKLSSLCVNKRDKHLIIDVHNYAPMEFTHQGAEWINGYDDTVSYSDEIADEFANSIKVVAKYQEKKHIKVIIGEFGVYLKQAKTEDVSAFLTSAVDVMDENNLPWCYWEYNQGFGAYDYHKKEWKPFVVDSLIK